MRDHVIKKLHSSSGESIAETLVAVLISAFALLMLAGTINSASNMITNSKNTLDDYYQKNNLVEEQSASIGNNATAIIRNIDSNNLDWESGYSVTTYTNSKFGSKEVISYKYNP